MENKKTQNLKRRLERYEKELETAAEGTEWFFKNQISILRYDLKDAEMAERKRIVRLNVKKINKMATELAELRKVTVELLSPKGYGSDYTEMRKLEEELEKKHGRSEFREILCGEN